MVANDGCAEEVGQVGQHAKMQLNLNASHLERKLSDLPECALH